MLLAIAGSPAAALAQQDGGAQPDGAAQQDDGDAEGPRYLSVMREELEQLKLPAVCETLAPTRGRCTFRHRGREARKEFLLHIVYSDETDTVYMYVERYLLAPPDAPETPRLLERLMELNWTLLAPRFEWEPVQGRVRLSALMHTDSNFDRRAFRSLVRTLTSEADRWWRELAAIVGQAEVNPPPDEPER